MKIVVIMLFTALVALWGTIEAAVQYDYLQFVQQSPRVFCFFDRGCDSSINLSNSFTVHGIWPESFRNPITTCVRAPFSIAEMNRQIGLKVILGTFVWPSFTINRPNMDFWSYEYNAHGTCADGNFRQTQYFELAYHMWDSYNAERAFCQAQIIRGSFYPRALLISAIQNSINGRIPQLRCHSDGTAQLLLEVVICFDPLGNYPIDCVKPSTCGPQDIMYIL